MALGRVEFVVIRFEGNKFRGEILPELEAIRRRGIIHLLDLIFVMKDKEGRLEVKEISDLAGGEGKRLAGEMVPMLSMSDVETVARDIPNNSSLALILFEHAWATRLREAIINAGGELVSQGTVPPEVVDQVEREMASQKKAA
jgi:hypothetical protein